jgi:hypothetical protein
MKPKPYYQIILGKLTANHSFPAAFSVNKPTNNPSALT